MMMSWNRIPLALAASLLIAVSAAGLYWKQPHQWDSIEDYLADHYSHDGPAFIAKAIEPVAVQDINKIMAGLDAAAGQQLSGSSSSVRHQMAVAHIWS